MNDTNEMKELKLKQSLDQTVGTLVEQGEKLINDCRGKIGQIDANQIRNVMAVANSAPHPAVVTNFIHYQMGRSGKPGKAWKDTKLGEAVVSVIDGQVRRLAKEVVEEAARRNKDTEHKEVVEETAHRNIDAVQMEMIRLLLGFMYRRYVYEAREHQSANQQPKEARS